MTILNLMQNIPDWTVKSGVKSPLSHVVGFNWECGLAQALTRLISEHVGGKRLVRRSAMYDLTGRFEGLPRFDPAER